MLAAIAMLLQLAVQTLPVPVLYGSRGSLGQPSLVLDEHALCLARDTSGGGTESPGDRAPAPDDHAFAACCPWHATATMALAPAAPLELIVFVQSDIVFAPSRLIASRRLTGAVGARAPPARA